MRALLAALALAVPGFHYDTIAQLCRDAAGQPGWNVPADRSDLESCGDYRGETLTYLQGWNADLRGANFDGASLLYLNNLDGADLRGATFRKATLDQVDLRDADLRGADLTEAVLTACPPPFTGGACLQGARFDGLTRLPFDRAEAVRRGMTDDAKDGEDTP